MVTSTTPPASSAPSTSTALPPRDAPREATTPAAPYSTVRKSRTRSICSSKRPDAQSPLPLPPPSGLVACRACSWLRFRCYAGQFPSTSCMAPGALHYPRSCLPASLSCLSFIGRCRSVQVITHSRLPGPGEDTRQEGGPILPSLPSFRKTLLCKRPNHPPLRRRRPLHAPAPGLLYTVALWSWTPTRLQSHGYLLASLLLTNVLVRPRHVRRQNATPIAYPIIRKPHSA